MTNKQLFIVRHGQTDYNQQNIVQGCGVDMAINDTGLWQAEQFYQTYQHYPFNKVYTSGLQRTWQSVDGFIKQGIPHVVLNELNEISWGDFEGKPQTAEQKLIYNQLIANWDAGKLNSKIPNGESPIELQERQKKAAKLILADTSENILVCMHGRAMKSFLCLLLNRPLTEMEKFQHTNLCLYQLQVNNGTASIVKHNDTTHLLER